MRCRSCINYNYDVFSKSYVDGASFCGVHGRVFVDPDSKQLNLDSHGSCDFHPKFSYVQLTFNFDYE